MKEQVLAVIKPPMPVDTFVKLTKAIADAFGEDEKVYIRNSADGYELYTVTKEEGE